MQLSLLIQDELAQSNREDSQLQSECSMSWHSCPVASRKFAVVLATKCGSDWHTKFRPIFKAGQVSFLHDLWINLRGWLLLCITVHHS